MKFFNTSFTVCRAFVALVAVVACAACAAACTKDASAPAASAVDAGAGDALNPPAKDAGVDTNAAAAAGAGKDTARIPLEELKCAPPSKKGGMRVCGQSLLTRVAKDGSLVGFAASLEGMTLFGLKKAPAHRGELVAFGAPGQDAILVQADSDANGRFDAEIKTPHPAFVICPGRVVQTSDACKLIQAKPKRDTLAIALVANGSVLTWGTLPDDALVLLPFPPEAK